VAGAGCCAQAGAVASAEMKSNAKRMTSLSPALP
jgi:hypothetical protein